MQMICCCGIGTYEMKRRAAKKAKVKKSVSASRKSLIGLVEKAIMEMDGIDLFQDLFLFKNLNFDETVALARICKVERFPAGVPIIEENSLGRALFLIKSGTVGVYKGENERLLAKLGKGELFGEMSLVEDALTSATVKAEEDVEVVVLEKNSFMALLDSNERLGLKIYKSFCRILSERLRKMSGQIQALSGSARG